MIGTAAAVLLTVFIIYDLAPNFYARNLAPEVVKTLPEADVALTFDDGPHPVYTPRLLDLLDKYQVQATFFVLAENALEHPHLIARMKNEGHTVGIHSASHFPAWLNPPWRSARDLERCLQVFRQLQVPALFYRPPWGTFNLLTLRQARVHGLRTILWSLSPGDWRKNATAEQICIHILDRVETGDIILLHDHQGNSSSPEITLKALETIIPALLERGYHFATIEQASS